MSVKILRLFSMIVLLSITACGTIAPPVWETPEEEPTEVVDQAAEPTEVAQQPTAVPATVTPDVPTPTPTSEPPTATPVPPTPTSAPKDPITVLVGMSDPANGEVLFNTMIDEAGYACATCHYVDSEETKVGPGQLHLPERAATRVEGQVAERYIYNSITDPSAYVVEGFNDGLMPQHYAEIFSEQEIYDIIAYMMTLE